LYLLLFLSTTATFSVTLSTEEKPQWLLELEASRAGNPRVIREPVIVVDKPSPDDPGYWDITEGESKFMADGAVMMLFKGKAFPVDAHKRVIMEYRWVSVEVVYHGNLSSKIFHKPTCRYYNCDDCEMPLYSLEQATTLGYKPCGICKPGAP